jgi:hypothetical protein
LRNNTSQENLDEPGDYIPFTKCNEKEQLKETFTKQMYSIYQA